MKTVIYTCPYVPAEWITAHGLQANRLLLKGTDSAPGLLRVEGICPYVRSFIGEVVGNTNAGAVVVTTVCDQMRRSFDILTTECELPVFLMNVPNTWQSSASQKLYMDELKRLGRFLVTLGGSSPSAAFLAEVMLQYEAARKSVKASPVSSPIDGVPLAIVGGPLIKKDFEIFDIVEASGGRIVLDATETGERGMCAPFDHEKLNADPFIELAKAYFGGIQDASRRPNSGLYDWLEHKAAGRGVRGIIFHRHVWCDMWHAELQPLKERMHLPVLDIDSAGDGKADRQRLATRILAFMEMLQ